MVSSIGAYASDILQYMQIYPSITQNEQTTQGMSFQELMSNGKISTKQDNQSTGITTIGAMSNKNSPSTETYNEMDLNQDGQVTIDEIMRYTEMQMMEKMQEQIVDASNDESNKNENEKNGQSERFDMNLFKTQMATKAYQMGESLINTTIGAITQSFSI